MAQWLHIFTTVRPGNGLEMADIAGGGDEQVLEGDVYAVSRLAALDAPRESGRRDGDWMYRHVADQFIDEGVSPLPALPGSSTLDAVR